MICLFHFSALTNQDRIFSPSFHTSVFFFFVPLDAPTTMALCRSCFAEQVTALLSNRRLPARGWDDAQIEYLLTEISLMDSNNFSENVGVGEREGRVSGSRSELDWLFFVFTM